MRTRISRVLTPLSVPSYTSRVAKRRQLADPYGVHTYARRMDAVRRVHLMGPNGEPVCGLPVAALYGDDATCVACLARVGLYVHLYHLRAHQSANRIASQPVVWKPILPSFSWAG